MNVNVFISESKSYHMWKF